MLQYTMKAIIRIHNSIKEMLIHFAWFGVIIYFNEFENLILNFASLLLLEYLKWDTLHLLL